MNIRCTESRELRKTAEHRKVKAKADEQMGNRKAIEAENKD